MPIISVTKDHFRQEVLQSGQTVLVDFWAPWCGPCRMLAPILEEIAGEQPELKICKVNVDQEDALAKEFRIASIPTLLVVKNGQITARTAGVLSKAEILNML